MKTGGHCEKRNNLFCFKIKLSLTILHCFVMKTLQSIFLWHFPYRCSYFLFPLHLRQVLVLSRLASVHKLIFIASTRFSFTILKAFKEITFSVFDEFVCGKLKIFCNLLDLKKGRHSIFYEILGCFRLNGPDQSIWFSKIIEHHMSRKI